MGAAQTGAWVGVFCRMNVFAQCCTHVGRHACTTCGHVLTRVCACVCMCVLQVNGLSVYYHAADPGEDGIVGGEYMVSTVSKKHAHTNTHTRHRHTNTYCFLC